MARPIVLLYEPVHPQAMAVLDGGAEVRRATSVQEEALISQVADVDGILIRGSGRVSRRLMAAAPVLRVIGRHGVGLDNIDLGAAWELGITVVNTPEAVAESVAEHALGLMLALAKQIVRGDAAARRGAWQLRLEYTGTELHGRTLGVVGFGRIGRQTARLCHYALQMPVVYHDLVAHPEAEAELGARRVALDELLSTADVVSLHVPLVPATRHLIGVAELHRMKPTAYLLNTARGPVVDQAALVRGLQEGWIAGAGLDVFDPEPLAADNALVTLENVVLTPHMASQTEQGLLRMGMVVQDILAVLQGRPPRYPVAPDQC